MITLGHKKIALFKTNATYGVRGQREPWDEYHEGRPSIVIDCIDALNRWSDTSPKTVQLAHAHGSIYGAYAFSMLQLPQLIWRLSGVGQTRQATAFSGQKRPR